MKIKNIEFTFECPECGNDLIYNWKEDKVYKITDIKTGENNECCIKHAEGARNRSEQRLQNAGIFR